MLGAGNGSDLDLPALAERFASLHLVDIDGEALERCRAGAPRDTARAARAARGRRPVGLHRPPRRVGRGLPGRGRPRPRRAARDPRHPRQLGPLGRSFDVVVSTCALSQLAVPYHRAWILPASDWANLHAAVTAVHLATLAGRDEARRHGHPDLRRAVVEARAGAAGARRRAARRRGGLRASATPADGGHMDPEPADLLARLDEHGPARRGAAPDRALALEHRRRDAARLRAGLPPHGAAGAAERSAPSTRTSSGVGVRARRSATNGARRGAETHRG